MGEYFARRARVHTTPGEACVRGLERDRPMNLRSLLASGLLLACLPACGADDAAPVDPASADADIVSEDGKEDSLSSTSTYYRMRRDTRRCAAPACGGYFVARVNASTTRCLDGVSRAECYVTSRDLSPLLLDAETLANVELQVDTNGAVLRGAIARNPLFRSFGRFVASEGWLPATTARATGTFYRAAFNGRVCIAAPCADVHEAKLNSTVSTDVAGVELERVTEKPTLLDAARQDLDEGGILVAGTNHIVTGPAGRALALTPSQFYLRARPKAAERACGGFVGGGCADGETCDITIPYACGGADLLGVCVPSSRVCTALQPVCGCDGVTYSSDCQRIASGVQKNYDGACNTR